VIAKIAGGGMSAVYLGRRVVPAADVPAVVALKIARHDVAKNEQLVQMFLEEGKLLARLVHPNIVRTLEVGGDSEQDFIAMELMLGKTFAAIHDAVVARNVRLNPEIAAWAAARIADALHYAHELADEYGRPLELVHRDVNPANVFATFQGEVKLFDFGLAKVTAGEVTGSKILAGKLSYLSPEQIMQKPLDRRSDVFSLGTTLWELLTSKRLFRRESDGETVRAVQLGPIPDPRSLAPEIPEELARITRTALERNRDHRYPSAAHVAHELDTFVRSRTSPADVTTRISQLVDALFPGEQKRQAGWLKPAITSSSSRTMNAVTVTGSVRPSSISARPPLDASETTAVMAHAPLSPPSSRRDSGPVTAREAPPSFPPPSRTGAPPPSIRTGAPPPPAPTTRGASFPPAPPSVRSAPPPLSPRSAPPRPPSRTDVQAMPPRHERSFPPVPAAPTPIPTDRESSPNAKPGFGVRPQKRAPIPLPSRARTDSIPPPKPAAPPRPIADVPLDSDTTEIEAILDDGQDPR
jgi:serine/threonine protein kinase